MTNPFHLKMKLVSEAKQSSKSVSFDKQPKAALGDMMKELNSHHYGMTQVKELFAEYLALEALTGSFPKKPICIVGPTGVGKRSFIHTASKILKRPLYTCHSTSIASSTAIEDDKEYIQNTLLFIEQVDVHDSTTLLKILTSDRITKLAAENCIVDLSTAMIVCSAVDRDDIPDALAKHLEIMNVVGFTDVEKYAIASDFLIPKLFRSSGLTASDLSFPEESIHHMVQCYSREEGVAELFSNLERIFRKAATNKILGSGQLIVDSQSLTNIIGKPKRFIDRDRFFAETPIGVSMGLGYTGEGGCILYVETTVIQRPFPELITTGQMGPVMKESTAVAYSLCKTLVQTISPGNTFFESNSIHLHMPEGYLKKEGPSAGLAMVCAMLSLATNKRLMNDFAISGEVSLTGRILAVGGIHEKVIMAKRCRVKSILLPRANMNEWLNLPEHLQSGMTAIFLDCCSELGRFFQ